MFACKHVVVSGSWRPIAEKTFDEFKGFYHTWHLEKTHRHYAKIVQKDNSKKLFQKNLDIYLGAMFAGGCDAEKAEMLEFYNNDTLNLFERFIKQNIETFEAILELNDFKYLVADRDPNALYLQKKIKTVQQHLEAQCEVEDLMEFQRIQWREVRMTQKVADKINKAINRAERCVVLTDLDIAYQKYKEKGATSWIDNLGCTLEEYVAKHKWVFENDGTWYERIFERNPDLATKVQTICQAARRRRLINARR